MRRGRLQRIVVQHCECHLAGAAKPTNATNQRNGKGAKTVLTEDGPIRIEVPRERDGSFEPILIPKHERRFTGFDDKIVAMYARGMTVREIQGFLLEQYGTEVSPDFISSVTDEVMAELTAWQARPLEPMYPVVFFDALRKIMKTRGRFPTDEAATKLIWLSLRNITANWGSAAHDWKTAMNQFAILYAVRFVRPSL